jgi:hypothetical protein
MADTAGGGTSAAGRLARPADATPAEADLQAED